MQKTLQEIREGKGVKKGAVAAAIGVTYPTYQKYEENPMVMPVEKFVMACDFLGCSVTDIFLPKDCN